MHIHGVSELTPASEITEIAQIERGDHWIIFWEDPVLMILRQIKDQERLSSEELLRRWMESASDILKAVRRHRNQVTLINLAEARHCPEALKGFFKERFGIDGSVTPSGLPQWAELSPVFERISRQSVRELQTLLQELEASSFPLDPSFESATSSRSLPPTALFAALNALRRMEHDGVPKEQLLAAERQVETSRSELAEQRKLLDQKNQELSRAEEIAHEKYELLLTELHEAFKESEGYFEQWKKAESERDEALQVANRELEQLRAQLGERDREQESLLGVRHELETVLANVQNQSAEQQTLLHQKEEALRASEEKALQNCEMLLTELHEAFKESEGYFEQWKKAESSGHGLILKVGAVSRGNVVDQGSHRHLEYTFQSIELLGRSWPSFRARLVRHNGHAGLLLFQSAPYPPLHGWKLSGEEGGSQYMLVVPHVTSARHFLIHATASDLLMIRDCAATILADLRMNGLPEGGVTDWICVAESLISQINEIPERLYYDSVQSRVEGSSVSRLEFDILNAHFRGRLYHSLRISWDTTSGVVTLFPDENSRPVLSAWPIDSAGRNRERCELFGPAPSVENPHSGTVSLTSRDRAFLGVLLGEIPNFLVHAANQDLQHGSRIACLRGRAKGLRRKALKLKSIG